MSEIEKPLAASIAISASTDQTAENQIKRRTQSIENGGESNQTASNAPDGSDGTPPAAEEENEQGLVEMTKVADAEQDEQESTGLGHENLEVEKTSVPVLVSVAENLPSAARIAREYEQKRAEYAPEKPLAASNQIKRRTQSIENGGESNQTESNAPAGSDGTTPAAEEENEQGLVEMTKVADAEQESAGLGHENPEVEKTSESLSQSRSATENLAYAETLAREYERILADYASSLGQTGENGCTLEEWITEHHCLAVASTNLLKLHSVLNEKNNHQFVENWSAFYPGFISIVLQWTFMLLVIPEMRSIFSSISKSILFEDEDYDIFTNVSLYRYFCIFILLVACQLYAWGYVCVRIRVYSRNAIVGGSTVAQRLVPQLFIDHYIYFAPLVVVIISCIITLSPMPDEEWHECIVELRGNLIVITTCILVVLVAIMRKQEDTSILPPDPDPDSYANIIGAASLIEDDMMIWYHFKRCCRPCRGRCMWKCNRTVIFTIKNCFKCNLFTIKNCLKCCKCNRTVIFTILIVSFSLFVALSFLYTEALGVVPTPAPTTGLNIELWNLVFNGVDYNETAFEFDYRQYRDLQNVDTSTSPLLFETTEPSLVEVWKYKWAMWPEWWRLTIIVNRTLAFIAVLAVCTCWYRIYYHLNKMDKIMKNAVGEQLNVKKVEDVELWMKKRDYVLKNVFPITYGHCEFGIAVLFYGTIALTVWLIIEIFFLAEESADFFEELPAHPFKFLIACVALPAMIVSSIIFGALMRPYEQQSKHLVMLRRELLRLRLEQDKLNFSKPHTFMEKIANHLQNMRYQPHIAEEEEKDIGPLDREVSVPNDMHAIEKKRQAKEEQERATLIHALENVIYFCETHPANPTILGNELTSTSMRLFRGYLLTIVIGFVGKALASF